MQIVLTVDQSLSMDSPNLDNGYLLKEVIFFTILASSEAEIGLAPSQILTFVSIFALGRSTAPDIWFD